MKAKLKRFYIRSKNVLINDGNMLTNDNNPPFEE